MFEWSNLNNVKVKCLPMFKEFIYLPYLKGSKSSRDQRLKVNMPLNRALKTTLDECAKNMSRN